MAKNKLKREDYTLVIETIALTFLTMYLGYRMLSVPYLKLIVYLFITALAMVTLLDFYGYMIEEIREKRKTNKSKAKK